MRATRKRNRYHTARLRPMGKERRERAPQKAFLFPPPLFVRECCQLKADAGTDKRVARRRISRKSSIGQEGRGK